MKTTVDLPDELHRRVKLKAVSEGTSINSVVVSLLTNWAIESWQEARQYHEATKKERPFADVKGVHPTGTARGQDFSKQAQAKGRLGR